MTEIWKDISGYEGLYQVSNLGRVRSVERELTNSVGVKKTYKSKILKSCANQENCGHLRVNLHKNGKVISCYVHRLVAACFVPNPQHHNVVNHKDFDTTNNKASNLEWCSQQENVRYSAERMKKPRSRCKPTNTNEKYIRRMGNRYFVCIRRSFGVSKSFDTLEDAVAYRDGVLR